MHISKKLLLIIVPVVLILAYLFGQKRNINPQTNGQIVDSRQNQTQINYQGEDYTIVWAKVNDTAKLKLIPNFEESLSPSEIAEEHGCELVVNGGFYDTDTSPIGLFVHEGDILGVRVSNKILNGIFYVTTSGMAVVSRDVPNEEARIALQTGPILMEKGSKSIAELNTDKPARRIFLAILEDGDLIFGVVMKDTSVYDGPYLEYLPDIILMLDEENDLGIDSAINLDGGTASVFYSDSVNIPPLSPVGSYFCIM